jgi:hypothetical protein
LPESPECDKTDPDSTPDAVYLASERIDDVLQTQELDLDFQTAKSAVERLVAVH